MRRFDEQLDHRPEVNDTHIGRAVGVGTRVVRVEVLMHVVDKVGVRAIGVGHGAERRSGPVADELLGGGVVVPGEKDDLAGGTGLADSGNGGLDGRGPCGDVGNVVGLVHDTEDDPGLRGVLLGDLLPQVRELSVGDGSVALSDDVSLPAGYTNMPQRYVSPVSLLCHSDEGFGIP